MPVDKSKMFFTIIDPRTMSSADVAAKLNALAANHASQTRTDFDPDQPRDESGKFASTGGGGGAKVGGNAGRSLIPGGGHGGGSGTPDKSREAKIVAALDRVGGHVHAGRLPGTVTSQHQIAQDALSAHEQRLPGALQKLKDVTGSSRVTGRTKDLPSAITKVASKADDAAAKGKPINYKSVADLQDLTGMRIVTPDLASTHDAVAKIRQNYKVIKEDDYTTKPQPGGYRAHHLIVEDEGAPKEIQIQTDRQRAFQDWSHDVYKPQNDEQHAAVGTPLNPGHHATEAKAYGEAVSKRLYNLDAGLPSGERPADPHPAILHAFGRPRMDAKSPFRGW